jgi:hypothetical protein
MSADRDFLEAELVAVLPCLQGSIPFGATAKAVSYTVGLPYLSLDGLGDSFARLRRKRKRRQPPNLTRLGYFDKKP